jgi:hypothetical protein
MIRPTKFSSENECSTVEGQLWSVNRRAMEVEESPLLRFVTRKRIMERVID